MTTLILKLFGGNKTAKTYRTRCILVAGITGILCNFFLFGIKLLAGILSGSVSIITDAFNNLSDSGSSVVTLFGIKLASKPADPEHPFGHGRMEYMSAAVVSALIMLVGVELLGESISKLKNPSTPSVTLLTVGILIVSILTKLWMAFFNQNVSKSTDSAALKATAADCLNDCISTGTVLIVSLISLFAKDVTFVRYLDPAVGILVALFILYSGFKSLCETLDPLIGLAPDPETVESIKELVLSNPIFLGIHDMIVHNYGPGRSFVSLHVEVDSKIDILYCHEKIDLCEKQIFETVGFEAVIHMDPIVTDDEVVTFVRNEMVKKLTEFDKRFTLHDFRMVKGETRSNLIFDVCVPADCPLSSKQIKEIIGGLAKDINSTYVCVVTIDRDFINR